MIQASGRIRIGTVPKDSELAQFVKPFLRAQYVNGISADKNTLNRVIETSMTLYGAVDGVSFERASVAIIDGMIGYYDEINTITGESISSKEGFDEYIKELWKDPYIKRGRPRSNPGDYLTYSFEVFWVAYPDAYARAKKKWYKPTQEQVGGEMEPISISASTLKKHIRTYKSRDPHRMKWPPPPDSLPN